MISLNRPASEDDGAIANGADDSSVLHLPLRFAIYTAVGLALAAVVIVVFVRSYAIDQAEASVKRHSSVVARQTLAGELRAADFTKPVGPKRRAALDRIFRDRVLADGVVEAVFLAPTGRVTYSTTAAQIGRRSQDAAEVRRVFGSTALESRLGTRNRNGETQDVMKVFVPARFDGSRAPGVLVLSHEWESTLASARRAYIAIALVPLALIPLALYLLLLPVLRRVTKRVHDEPDETEEPGLHDGLTGLPNRMLFHDRAEQALLRAERTGEDVAVMLIHLDRFVHISETLGPESGNVLLRELAERLSSALRATDTFARLGGAEFGVVAPAVQDDLTMIVERILAVVDRPFFLDGVELDVDASMGIARYPRDAADVTTLVLRADIARDKATEENTRYAFYEPGQTESDAPLTLVSDLRAGIAADELTLDFQPTFDLHSGAIMRAEALVRWRHPDRGLLEPADFLDEASETMQTPALTRWVLDSALRECSAWRDRGWRLPVAVNVDLRSLLDESFVNEVELALNRNGIDAELLELEITEETVRTEPVRVATVVSRLSEFGVKLVLDNFGGLSSLSSLQGLPIHGLKIDGSLVVRLGRDSTVKPIVGSILSLGRTFNLRVVAEGIETQAAMRAVVAAKCRFGQGFLLAEPLPADEFMLVLAYTRQQEPAAATA